MAKHNLSDSLNKLILAGAIVLLTSVFTFAQSGSSQPENKTAGQNPNTEKNFSGYQNNVAGEPAPVMPGAVPLGFKEVSCRSPFPVMHRTGNRLKDKSEYLKAIADWKNKYPDTKKFPHQL